MKNSETLLQVHDGGEPKPGSIVDLHKFGNERIWHRGTGKLACWIRRERFFCAFEGKLHFVIQGRIRPAGGISDVRLPVVDENKESIPVENVFFPCCPDCEAQERVGRLVRTQPKGGVKWECDVCGSLFRKSQE